MAGKNLSQPKSPFYIPFRAFQFTLALALLVVTIYLRWGYKIKGHFGDNQDASSDQEKSIVTVSSFHREQSGNTDEHGNPDNYAITNTNILSPFVGLSLVMGAALSSVIHSLATLVTYHRKTLYLTFTPIWDFVLSAMYVAGFILIGKFLSDTDAWGTEAPIIYLYKAVFGATIIAMVSFFVTGVIGLEMRGEAKSNKKYPLPTAKYEPLDDCRANPLP